MKKNIFGILLFLLTTINALYMVYYLFSSDLGIKNMLYVMTGTLISGLILLFLLQKKVYAYIIGLIFNAIQIIGTTWVFDNFRYGLILRLEFESDYGTLDVNFTALILALLSLLGYYRFKKVAESKRKSDHLPR